MKLPAVFKRKIVVDRALENVISKDVVDLHDYKTLKKEQVNTYNECDKLYYPSKHDKKP